MTHEQLNSKNQVTMETMEEPVFLNPVELENSTKNTRYLYERIWRESTLCVMHGPREVDKTDLAIDIALDIIKNNRGKVLYVSADGSLAKWTARKANFGKLSGLGGFLTYSARFNDAEDERDFSEIVFQAVRTAHKHRIKTVIISSINRIAAMSKGRYSRVANVMKELALMQMRYGLSILVIADTKTKRSANVLFDYAESDIDMNPPKPEKKPRKVSAKKDATETQAPTPPSADNADNATPFFRIKSGGANNRLATPLRR